MIKKQSNIKRKYFQNLQWLILKIDILCDGQVKLK